MTRLPILLALLCPFVLAADFRDLEPAEQAVAASEKRVALVIGNGAYAAGPLKNPPSDARSVAAALTARGFRVTLVTDADKDRMEEASIDFGHALAAGGVGLFYYAGHGIEQDGSSFLVPVDAELSDDAYIRSRTVEVVGGCTRAGRGPGSGRRLSAWKRCKALLNNTLEKSNDSTWGMLTQCSQTGWWGMCSVVPDS